MINLTRPDGSRPGDLDLTRRGVAAVFFSGYAASALSATAEPIHTDEAGLVIEAVTLSPPDGFALPAYVARPAASRPSPGGDRRLRDLRRPRLHQGRLPAPGEAGLCRHRARPISCAPATRRR